jgi:hypothetical protein
VDFSQRVSARRVTAPGFEIQGKNQTVFSILDIFYTSAEVIPRRIWIKGIAFGVNAFIFWFCFGLVHRQGKQMASPVTTGKPFTPKTSSFCEVDFAFVEFGLIGKFQFAPLAFRPMWP